MAGHAENGLSIYTKSATEVAVGTEVAILGGLAAKKLFQYAFLTLKCGISVVSLGMLGAAFLALDIALIGAGLVVKGTAAAGRRAFAPSA